MLGIDVFSPVAAMNNLGIDIGTSAVKAVLVDEEGAVLAEAAAPVPVRQPKPGWSEQDPDDWWRATEAAVAAVRRAAEGAFSGIGAIGLSGQMHGAVVLDAADRPIRPAILWNDGRASAECAALEAAVPDLAQIAGVVAMPGFTAPKLLWLRAHEPDSFARIARVLLAKDHVRLKLAGSFATDMTDAAGTLLLDEAARAWSEPVAAACGLLPANLPQACEGPEPTGTVRPAVAAAWGLTGPVVVAAGGGDAAAGAVGIGAIDDGDAFISLGTSAQFFVTRDRYEPKPETLVHAFAHALPGRWFEMAAMLNGASVLDFAARLFGAGDIGALLDRLETRFAGPSPVLFLPYLSGERTPYNDPDVRAAFAGLDTGTSVEDLLQAVLDGVVFSLMDAQRALGSAGLNVTSLAAVGGGARSRFWLRLIASGLGLPIRVHAGADKGPAFGAARLGRMAATGESAAAVCVKPATVAVVEPDKALGEGYAARFPRYRALYPAVRRPSRGARAGRPPAARR